ncbi:vang-1 [Pristionchus pacificus]|uniref:Vang-1 n=1 Tax=Pristionchus pacificus TaxID=54126 RepID=A0A2A6D0S6_PRIPA|nr:vang-1 [Pristionchus pacificus]|eukprot:PDM83978.1 vang-1 [Pristionchus pacificus]
MTLVRIVATLLSSRGDHHLFSFFFVFFFFPSQMSVVSERSATRPRYQSHPQRPRPLGGRGRGYSQSDVGGFDQPLIYPQHHNFSAIASEGQKRLQPYDNWADDATAVTGASENDFLDAYEENKQIDSPVGTVVVRRCSRLLWLMLSSLICISAFLSAPLMVTIPFFLHHYRSEWPAITCELDCQGNLFDLAFKSFFLLVAQLAMYYRRATADLPRLYFARAAITFLVLFELIGFWLFYAVRILLERQAAYIHITSFALSLLNALLCTHYLSLIVLELRKHRKEYYITIVRDPDGESKTMSIGKMSLQEAAVQVLRFYQAQFPSFNIGLDRARNSTNRMTSFAASELKVYDIENMGREHSSINEDTARTLMEQMARRRPNRHYDMYKREQDWEQKVNKRKYRFLAASEDLFSQVLPVYNQHEGPKNGEMDLRKTAESMYTCIHRTLTKYLKVTKQTERNSPEAVKDHIEKLSSMSPSGRFPVDLPRLLPLSMAHPSPFDVTIRKRTSECNLSAQSLPSHSLTSLNNPFNLLRSFR